MSSHVHAPYRRALVRMATAAVAWGAGGAAAALIFRVGGLGPVATSFWRLAVATLFTLALRQRRAPADGRRWPAAVAGLGMAASQTAYFASVRAAGLALGTLVTLGGAIVCVVAGGRLFLREAVSRRALMAAAVAVGGLLVLVETASSAGTDPVFGILLALVAAATYSSVTLVGRATGGAATSALTFAVGTVGLLPPAALEGLWPRHLAVTLPCLAFLGIVATALAYRWYFVALATVPAVAASVVTLLEPATATLLAVATFGERLSARALLGSVTIVAAAVSLARDGS